MNISESIGIVRTKKSFKAVTFLVFFSVLILTIPNADAGIIVDDFEHLITLNGDWYGTSQTVRTNYGDNLMFRDPETGIDSVVEKDGGVWRMGLIKYLDSVMTIGGFVNNDNPLSNNYPETYGGYLLGLGRNSVFASGDKPEEVMLIHDQLGNGIGTISGGSWNLGTDDVVYWSEDIEFNGNQGDLSQMPAFTFAGDTLILPHMVVNPVVPEPTTMVLIGTGLISLMTLIKRGKRNNAN